MRKTRSNKLFKAAQKEIRSGQALFDPKEKATLKQEVALKEKLTPRDVLKLYPKKLAAKDKPIAEANINRMKVKKIKMKAAHSKRTTPGEVEAKPAAPRNSHIEGGRWKQTVDNQSVINRKSLDRKLLRNKKR